MPVSEQNTAVVLGRLEERLDRQDRTLDEILAQCKRTNGRVTALETQKAVAAALADRDRQTKRQTVGHYRWVFESAVALGVLVALVIEASRYL